MSLRVDVVLVTLFLAMGCGSGDPDGAPDDPGSSGGTAGTGASGTGSVPPSSGTGGVVLSSGGTSGGEVGQGGACATTSASATLRPVTLAFAFDVSGSMGKLDYEWHDPTLKWEPVVAATEAFFADPASAGLYASLTFFPDSSDRCEPAQYVEPDVHITALPSSVFAQAITAVTPQTSDDWRGGTPTLAVVTGTITMLEAQLAAGPDITPAIVLVTDGYPQNCDDDAIESVAAAVSAVADRIPTYVIGVRNPPVADAPDTVSNLEAVAVAGGTGQAYFIDTGNPALTTQTLLTAVNAIRGDALSCDIAIPPPPAGQAFDPQRVRVNYTSGATTRSFPFDAACAGTEGWHYNDPAAPTTIHLCPDTCAAVQGDPAASLAVEFACEIVIPELR